MSEFRTPSEHLRDYYESRTLDPSKRERIEQLVQLRGERAPGRGAPTAPARALSSRRIRWLAAAGVAAAVLVAGIASLRGSVADGSLPLRVAEEIALNHGKQLAVEFTATSYRELARRMDKLDFDLRASPDARVARLGVLGARYCSIQGGLAAQVKLREAGGQVLTMYQTALTDELGSVPAGEQIVDGVRIRLWREGDRLLGLARSIE